MKKLVTILSLILFIPGVIYGVKGKEIKLLTKCINYLNK